MTFADVVVEALNINQDSIIVLRCEGRLTEHQLDDLRAAFEPILRRFSGTQTVIVCDEGFTFDLERMPKTQLTFLRDKINEVLSS